MPENRATSFFRTAIGVVFVAAFAILFAVFLTPNSYENMTGVVVSSGSISSSGLDGGTIEISRVRLDGGQEVSARVRTKGPLKPGDHVQLFTEGRLMGGPLYYITSKNPQAGKQ